MAASNQSPVVTVRCRGEWEEGVRTRLQIRRFAPLRSDEPEQLGGTDQGPNPMEYILAALNGCVSVMLHMVARELGFAYEGVELEAEGDIDVRGLQGVPGVRPHFQAVRQRVRVTTSEPPERLALLKETVESRCPVANLLKDAGANLTATWVSV